MHCTPRLTPSRRTVMTNADLSALKADLRQEVLAKRDALPPEQRIEGSIAAAQAALTLSCFDPGRFLPGTNVSAFLPIRSEIDARPLMARLGDLGARLCLPAMISKTQIEFRELTRETRLVEAAFKTIVPENGSTLLDPKILIVPLSAFDSDGGRLGYGAGYYDRVIEKLAAGGIDPVLIGLAFETQRVDAVPMEPHDRRLDAIVTDHTIHKVTERA